MTITKEATALTPVPAKTDDLSWDDFTTALKAASEAEEVRLAEVIPIPAVTGKPGSDEWNSQFDANYRAKSQQRDALSRFQSKLVLAVGAAVAGEVEDFSSIDINYEGSGDSGEACDIYVSVSRKLNTDGNGKHVPFTDEETAAYRAKCDAANSLLSSDLREWLDETCWGIAYAAHPGFETDAGGFGTITIAREDGELQLTLEHTERTEVSYATEVLA